MKSKRSCCSKAPKCKVPSRRSLIYVRFRWVQCQLSFIKELKRHAARREALNNLPPGLTETYIRILDRIGMAAEDLKIVTAALTWIVRGKRPLRLSELAIATALLLQTDEGIFDEDQKLYNEEVLLVICGAFIKLNDETKVVELCHFSVAEFLTSSVLPDGTANAYYIDNNDCHLLRACIRYMSSPPFTSGRCKTGEEITERGHEYPFTSYSALHWSQHAQGNVLSDPRIVDLVREFLSARNIDAWIQMYEEFVIQSDSGHSIDPLNFSWNYLWKLYDPGTSLYYASLFGLLPLVDRLLQEGADSKERGGFYNYPLHAAVHNGNSKVVRPLIEAGGDIDQTDLNWETPLHLAASLGKTNIVQMLIECGTEQGLSSSKYCGVALHGAVSGGHPEIIQMLLDAGADVDSVHDGETALFRAVSFGAMPLSLGPSKELTTYPTSADLTAILVEADADVNFVDQSGGSVLHNALRFGNREEVVKVLIAAGVDVNIKDNSGNFAYHKFLYYESEKEILRILNDGIDVYPK